VQSYTRRGATLTTRPQMDGWPELHPNLHYWNSQNQINGRGVAGESTIGGRAMYLGACLHRGHR